MAKINSKILKVKMIKILKTTKVRVHIKSKEGMKVKQLFVI